MKANTAEAGKPKRRYKKGHDGWRGKGIAQLDKVLFRAILKQIVHLSYINRRGELVL
ncbi:MAG: hypothetical protein K0Q90_2276 [Paenibacillaceae bacterium]|jgi:hypothetical protein|nr:hypothetical protein [Paenibacillaceae bacterium]